jgi:TusA-related sulfurtransferase
MTKLTVKSDLTVDAMGTWCPVPILRAADHLHRIAVGEVLELLATDEAVLGDLPAWCRATGQEFLGFEVELPVYRGYARRTR